MTTRYFTFMEYASEDDAGKYCPRGVKEIVL